MSVATLAFVVIAYLLGSIPFAVVSSRIFRLPDPRTYGSGNPGATNVLRTGRKGAAVLTLLGDAFKGWLAVFVAQRLAAGGAVDIAVSAAAVAVTFGHMFPVFLRFRGGKGVSTATGVLLALDPWLAAGAVATWLIIEKGALIAPAVIAGPKVLTGAAPRPLRAAPRGSDRP